MTPTPNLLKYLTGINPTTSMSLADQASLPKVGMDSTSSASATYLSLFYHEKPIR